MREDLFESSFIFYKMPVKIFLILLLYNTTESTATLNKGEHHETDRLFQNRPLLQQLRNLG